MEKASVLRSRCYIKDDLCERLAFSGRDVISRTTLMGKASVLMS